MAPARNAAALLIALRPRQWTKNLLVFGALVFAAELDEPVRWLEAGVAFVAFCLVSSAAYLLNDVRDAPQDRLHPKKRLRPIASGALSPQSALQASGALAVAGLALGLSLNLRFELYLVAFALLQVAYTLGLKRVPLVDVCAIASGFVLRAGGGAAAVHVHASGWLLLTTALLALFLGFSKRRSELVGGGAGGEGRAVLRIYSRAWLDALVGGSALAVSALYVAYCAAAHSGLIFLVTALFVVGGLARYLYLVYGHDLGEEPEHLLVTDRVILACVALWALTAALILLVP